MKTKITEVEAKVRQKTEERSRKRIRNTARSGADVDTELASELFPVDLISRNTVRIKRRFVSRIAGEG
jgi:hypothetical protein